MTLPSDTDPPAKVASTVTRQPVILGSFKVAWAFGASGPAWLTIFAASVMAMVVAGTSVPFTTVSAVTARGLVGFIAARRSGEGDAAGVTGAAAFEAERMRGSARGS